MHTKLNKTASVLEKKKRRLKLENSIEYAFFQARKKINYEYIVHTKHTGLTPRQHLLLKNIQLHDAYNISQLVKKTQLDKSNLAVLASKLLEKGYIKIVKYKEDKRNQILSITEEGENALIAYEIQALKVEKKIRSVMPKGYAKQLLYYLTKLNMYFDDKT